MADGLRKRAMEVVKYLESAAEQMQRDEDRALLKQYADTVRELVSMVDGRGRTGVAELIRRNAQQLEVLLQAIGGIATATITNPEDFITLVNGLPLELRDLAVQIFFSLLQRNGIVTLNFNTNPDCKLINASADVGDTYVSTTEGFSEATDRYAIAYTRVLQCGEEQRAMTIVFEVVTYFDKPLMPASAYAQNPPTATMVQVRILPIVPVAAKTVGELEEEEEGEEEERGGGGGRRR